MRNPDNPSTLDAADFPQINIHDLAYKDLVVHGGSMRRSIPFAGPFTTAEAYAAGLTSGILRGPSVRRLFAGVYVRG